MSESVYSISEGIILKGDEPIALFDPETKTATTSEPLHHMVRKAITAALGEDIIFAVEGVECGEQKGEIPPVTIPPEPPKTLQDGDKTPEYVAWMRKYFPEKAERLYRGRNVA